MAEIYTNLYKLEKVLIDKYGADLRLNTRGGISLEKMN